MVKIKYIIYITEDLHNSITELYEDLADNDDIQALKKIDEIQKKIKDLKDSLIKKD